QPRLAPAPGGGGARDHVVLAGGVADAGAVVHAWGLDVRRVHVVAICNMRANRKHMISWEFLPCPGCPAGHLVRPRGRFRRLPPFVARTATPPPPAVSGAASAARPPWDH